MKKPKLNFDGIEEKIRNCKKKYYTAGGYTIPIRVMTTINENIFKKMSDKLQQLRNKVFETGRKFRDKTMKEFGYEYNQSWLLFDEDTLAELLDKYEEIIEDEREGQ